MLPAWASTWPVSGHLMCRPGAHRPPRYVPRGHIRQAHGFNDALKKELRGAGVSVGRRCLRGSRRYWELCRGLHKRRDAPNTSAGIPIVDCQRGGARRDRRLLGAASIASPATNAVGARMRRWSTAHRCRNFHGARKCTFFRQMHHCRAIHRGINHFCFSKAKCRKRSL
jgi:hypothetical protein